LKSLGCIAAAVVVTALAWRAAAAPSEENKAQARALLVDGSRHLQNSEYAEALAKFEQAYELVPSPKIQYNFGICYVNLDRPADAYRAFESFVANAGDAPPANVAKAREYLAKLPRRVAVIQLEGDLTGAEVSVDGRSFGQTAKVLVDPGPHVLTVDRKGETPYLQRLTAAAGDRFRFDVKFAPPPAPPEPKHVATIEPTAPPRTGLPPPPRRDLPEPAPGRAWQRPAGYFAAGLAGALVVGGVGARLMANQKYEDFNDLRGMNGVKKCGRVLMDKGGPDCQKLLSSGDSWSRLALVGFVGAGAAAVASFVLFFTAPSGKPDVRPEVSLACAPDVGLRGAACQLRF
jgi:hypothetical protein